jgi:hypothetical protein
MTERAHIPRQHCFFDATKEESTPAAPEPALPTSSSRRSTPGN